MYKKITLEMSIKPFKKTDDEYIRAVSRKVFEQWRPLVKDSEVVSIMLWTSDGSEMLDYSGEMSDEFEWCRFLGTANLKPNPTGDDSVGPHTYRYDYIKNPPKMTYGVLKNIAKILKEEGASVLSKTVLVGNTFDIGPEFALSDFKYNRHKEIIQNTSSVDRLGLVDCTATLHSDTRKYAAYPNGIPEGEPIGLFFGRQCDAFLRDMGMDFVWLSNGFGFSADPWVLRGSVFDGEHFDGDKLVETRRKVFEFWKYFRQGCPDYPVQVRGTNNSVGIDYATDAVPIYEIYNGGFDLTAPPNSPWAALNDDYGLEIMGHMTRVCELPSDGFIFRYYLHDPWWNNSPWYDRYGGEPMDVYMPCAVSRINERGEVETASTLNILSIDNTWGDLPDSCANEVLPHLLKAKKDAGDRPAPLVWVYPFREYSTTLDEETIREEYFGDKFMRDAINNSFPLNCVVSADNFLKTDLATYDESVLISPVPVNPEVTKKLEQFVSSGGRVVFYGSADWLKRVEHIAASKVDIAKSPVLMRRSLREFGYEIEFNRYDESKKTTTMTIARSNNAFVLSAYNQTTAIDVKLRFPQGVPVFIGTDAIIENGVGVFRMGRSEHLEGRLFVEQESGVVSAREYAPVNKMYRRKIILRGLNNATVRFYPESYCARQAIAGPEGKWDATPVVDERFKLVESKTQGVYYEASGISGDYLFCMPYPEYVKENE